METTIAAAIEQRVPYEKFLAYDGDCPMCLATVDLLKRWRLVRAEQLRSNHDLAGDELEAVRRAGIRNQLVVLDRRTGKTRSGSDALLWMMSDNARLVWLARLLGLPGARQLLRYAYQTISYNRRIISPPKHWIVCDCEPEVTAARRLSLIAPLVVVATAIVAGLAATTSVAWGLGGWQSALLTPLAAVAGWLALAAVALARFDKVARWDYVAHLAVTQFAGALALVPLVPLVLVVPRLPGMMLVIAVAIGAYAWMFAIARRRVAAQGLKQGWLWAWAAAVALSTLAALAAGIAGASA